MTIPGADAVPAAERRVIVEGWNGTTTEYPRDSTIPGLFAAEAARRPGALALSGAGRTVTYAELDAWSNRIAHHLRALGVSDGDLVGLALQRSPDLVAGVLGILKAGGAYVPLDPEYPTDRLRFMLEDIAAPVLLTEQALAERLPSRAGTRVVLLDRDAPAIASQPATRPASGTNAASPAYVMYTSGSTGQPKGVVVPHRAVIRLVRGNTFMRFADDEVFLLLAPISFDASTLELWGALLNGSKLAIAPGGAAGIAELGQLVLEHGVTTLWLTAAVFQQVVDTDLDALRPLRQLLAGGDVLPAVQARRVLSALPQVRLINGYGPTENTTFTCCHTVSAADGPDGPIPIGKPIANTTVYVLDEGMRPVSVGVPGELFAGGDGLALGYLHQEELTARRFVPNPFQAGQRIYRTGDRVRWRSDGSLEFLGRLDDQIKLRGFRIEPSEIARTLERHAAVAEAVVVLRSDLPGEPRLVAYVTLRGSAPAAPAELLDHLSRHLPGFMVPAAVVALAAFPLNANGKIDRRALPQPPAPERRASTPPATDLQRRIATIWSDLLGAESLALEDEFLRLGGHSLLAIQIASRIRQDLGVELPFTALLEHQTLGGLAAEVEQIRSRPQPAGRGRVIRPIPRERFRSRREPDQAPRPLMAVVDALDPARVALESLDRAALTYGDLSRFVGGAAAWLREAGLGASDTAALVLPNGPSAATAFLASATAGVCAPLNPAYRSEEFAFYLEDLQARLLLVPSEIDSPARDVAAKRGIRIVEIGTPKDAPAGVFALDGRVPEGGAGIVPPPDATALILHTSGTTARPKMVPLTHQNLSASAAHIGTTLGLSPEDRCLNVMPLFHIHGLVAAVLASLRAGASVVCTPGFLAPGFFRWLRDARPTWYTAVPTMHQAILARAGENENQGILRAHRLRFARSSSAPLPRRVLDELERTLGVPVIEAYGMTEAAHQIASNPLPPGSRKPGSVGQAAGPEIAILDAEGRRLATGQTGEIAIRGPNVTPGYRQNPEANARAFSDGWLRTGDQGVLDDQGYLTLTGRLKEQINRAGEKISPLEVDQVLLDHPAVANALSFSVSHPVLGEDIAAAVVLKPNAAPTERELRDYVAGRLAYFKTPRRIVFLDAIPTGPTGKLQRLGLAERLGVTADVPVDDLDLTAPRTPVEEIVAAAWAEVMGSAAPGVRRNFFALGGDSVLATRLVARLRDRLAVELPLLALFDAPSVEGISAAVDQLLATEPGEETPPTRNGIPRRADPARAPVTAEQLLLWEIERSSPGTPAYNLPFIRRIEGPIDLAILARAFEDLSSRHEAFRISFHEEQGGVEQRIAASVRLPVEFLDFRNQPGPAAENAAREALADRGARPFSLTEAPLCRVALARVSERESLLLVCMHHLVADGWSTGNIFTDLASAYAARARGEAPSFGPAPVDFGDYAAWIATPEQTALRRRHLEYWRGLLDGADLSVDLPTDHPPPSRPTFEGHTERALLPAALLAALEREALRHDSTLNALLLACFRTLLYRVGDQEDLTIGTVLAGRDTVEVERMVGYFARTALIRTRVTPTTTLDELCREIHAGIIDAIDHPASLAEVVSVMRDPLDWAFRLLFSFNEEPRSTPRLGDALVRTVPTEALGVKMDLGLALTRIQDGLEVVLSARAALYERDTARRFLDRYQALLEAVAAGAQGPIDRIPLFRAGEREQVLRLARGPDAPTRTDWTIGARFREQAARTPDATAIVTEDERWTFGELAGRAGRLAEDLAAQGIGRSDVVAILAGRSLGMVMAMVAVVLAGAAYLLIDPDQPAERIRGMLEDAGARLVLAEDEEAAAAYPTLVQQIDGVGPAGPASGAPRPAPTPEDPVYVVFTSGSTGRPKGVLVPNRALINHMDWMLATFPLGSVDAVLQRTPISFDASVWEMWAPLLAGCPMVLAQRDREADPTYLGELIRSQGVTEIQVIPSILALLLELGGLSGCDSLRRVFCGGEALPAELVRRFHAAHPADLVNLYGPAEVTIDATMWRTEPGFSGSATPIGRPITNVRAYVLDRYLEPRPIGLPGELYLGGASVALGYVNRPELTRERFLSDPFEPGGTGRLYRTGDRARLHADGTLDYLGRVDDQLKLHGIRIEPGEIEARINARTDVVESAVGVRSDAPRGRRLVAWVVPRPGANPGADAIREDLARSLPRAVIPGTIIFLEKLPRTPSGKLDRRSLPVPAAVPVPYEAPRTPLEELVAAVWAEILGGEPVGRNQDFFALGGHSLIAIRIANRLRGETGAPVSFGTILEHPTVAALAAELARRSTDAHRSESAPGIPRSPRVRRPTGTRPPGTRPPGTGT